VKKQIWVLAIYQKIGRKMEWIPAGIFTSEARVKAAARLESKTRFVLHVGFYKVALNGMLPMVGA
jgi:hypothetical protein